MTEYRSQIDEYIHYVIKDMRDIYGVNALQAHELLKSYNFYEMIMGEPIFIMNYNTEVWAERVFYDLKL